MNQCWKCIAYVFSIKQRPYGFVSKQSGRQDELCNLKVTINLTYVKSGLNITGGQLTKDLTPYMDWRVSKYMEGIFNKYM